jgi:branched-chain amino acid aminotransferase
MNYIYIDGEFVPEEEAKISVFDHGLLYGDGVFEGIRAYNGRVFRLEEHVKRLYDSAKAILLEIPMSQQEMVEAILQTLRKNRLRNGYIRPLVTRGVGDLGLDPRKCKKPTVLIITRKWDAMYGDLYLIGLTAVTVTARRNSPAALPPNIKSLNYLNNILGKIEANIKGGDEAIFLDDAGTISEGSGDNIFIVKDGNISTPPTLNNLRGITRQAIIDIAQMQGNPVRETPLGLFDIYTADEVFVTGTAAEIGPVTKIDGRIIGNGKPGTVTIELMKKFMDMATNTGTLI